MRKHSVLPVLALALAAGAASAGGIDRSGQGIGALFEPGRYAEISFGFVTASVSGTVGGGAVGSGDIAPNYLTFGAAWKQDFGDRFAVALIFDQPFGASVEYPTGTGYPFAGSTAELRTNAITAVGRYKFSDRFTVHAGLRYQTLEGETVLFSPLFPGAYTMSADRDERFGYLVGFAYEIPEIALRAAVTYNSKVEHTLATDEVFLGAPFAGEMTTTTPESVNLDFQTGIAADTLLMASVRWVNWPQFDISPPTFPANPLVSYADARTSYSLGVGRRFSDKFSASIILGYEPSTGTPANNLSPTDGFWSATVGGVYTHENMKITAGVRYVGIGDATTRLIGADFSGNSAIGVGVKVGFTF